MPCHASRLIVAIVAINMFISPAAVRADSPDPGPGIYKAKCAACHAADGSGNTSVGKSMKLRDLRSAEVQKQTDAELTKIITDGKAKMSAYGKKLTADEIKSVVAFVRTLRK